MSRVIVSIRKGKDTLLSRQTKEDIKRMVVDNIIKNVIDRKHKRPSPGGMLATRQMWKVAFRSNSPTSETLTVEAAGDMSMEFKHSGSISKPEDKRYAWSVEYGHRVHKPSKRIPFIKTMDGRLWRAHVDKRMRGRYYRESWMEPISKSGRPGLKFGSLGYFNYKRGRQRFMPTTEKVLWIKPGTRTSHVNGVFMVRDALDTVLNSKHVLTADGFKFIKAREESNHDWQCTIRRFGKHDVTMTKK